MAPLKLNRCKLRVGDKITALYIENPQGENYVNPGIQTNIIRVADEKGNTYALIDSFGYQNGPYQNSVFTGGDIYDVGSQSYLIANWSLNKIAQRLVFGGNDSLNTNRNLILYFTEPLEIVSAPTSNSNFDNDFQGIVAFTNTGRVNTGTFDPISDNPAGQKSLTNFIIETDLNSRWSRIGSYNFYGGFTNLPAFYSGKFKLIREVPFTAQHDYVLVNLFAFCKVREIDHNVYIGNFFQTVKSIDLEQGFIFCSSLEVISAEYDLSKVNNLHYCFYGCNSLKTIKLKHFPVSFDISASTRLEEADLVEIIGNLMDLTGKSSQTLTMGATNLAKLTDAEKAVAVNKNWALA